ncbi:lycopene cyclase domain-containing protein [Demequina sp. SYSU T00039]|uniref:Lycopene cyclase domain-containing protein n=1 Tax=Demequina lignilytica TaxID=3051663 RepID=A0AAW7M4K2_9MICO|nr:MULTISPECIES: lycopene cyclase domain-containing protein [unclassified Demequina]MDN4477779.1 lycopene cyclase domain-containing protein [Demequina sp. SYSU T00039-1]MDN4487688.1 lycopene cyclase domain-containing protein [Demequina sp. SYSU T00039]MDN4491399.1 lycopene cyclase domain-containing protein [Demequina sp. SYSU T00068]
MSQFAYLAALVVSIGGLAVLDLRYRIALFDQPRRTLLTVGLAAAAFLAWDAAGVGLGIFFIGGAPYLTGVVLAPEVPLEELFFLILLVYQTLLLWRWLDRRARAATREGAS